MTQLLLNFAEPPRILWEFDIGANHVCVKLVDGEVTLFHCKLKGGPHGR